MNSPPPSGNAGSSQCGHTNAAKHERGQYRQGPGTLDEYLRPGHVDAQLLNDVIHWIKEHQ